MGLAPAVLRHLIRLYRARPFAAPLLTLGVQDVLNTHAELCTLFAKEGVPARELPPAEREYSTSVFLANSGLGGAGFVHARTLFRMMGIDDYYDLDASTAEGPSLVHDLNRPIPASWHGRFGTLVDSGTLEHIFDLRTALANIAQLVAVGGTVIHVSPMSGWINHGFFQASPCLFYDFYEANGYEPGQAYVIQVDSRDLRGASKSYAYQHSLRTFNSDDRQFRSLLMFTAVRREAVKEIRNPIQGKYRSRIESLPIAPMPDAAMLEV